MYEFSYLDERNFLPNFHKKGGPLPKKNGKIFSHQDMTIHTPIESPIHLATIVYKDLHVYVLCFFRSLIRVFLKIFGKNNQNFHKDSIFGQ